MNFTLHGQTVNVSERIDGRIVVTVNGQRVGNRATMANALTLATHATACVRDSRHTAHVPPHASDPGND